ncbi:MAG: DNA-directed RNA polymerase subunit L [Candidatus Woesearchaeota archaeon]
MKLVILEKTKKKIVFRIEGVDHTICNILKTELYNDESVTAATYNIEHPLIGIPLFVVETNSNKNPEKAIQAAIKRLEKKNEQFLELWKKIKI